MRGCRYLFHSSRILHSRATITVKLVTATSSTQIHNAGGGYSRNKFITLSTINNLYVLSSTNLFSQTRTISICALALGIAEKCIHR